MNILITGGLGYLGTHILNELIKLKNVNIIIIDNFSNGDQKILTFFSNSKINLIKADIKNYKMLDKVFKKNNIDFVYHLAAKIDAKESVRKKNTYLKTNYLYTKKLVNLSNKYKIKKFFFASSAAVYGNPKNKYCVETQHLKPVNPYGLSKLLAEKYICSNLKNSKFYIFRIFNLIGLDPKFYHYFKNRQSVFFKLLNLLKLKKKKFRIFQYYSNKKLLSTERDFIDVRDVSKILVKSLLIKKKNFIINLGSGKSTSIMDLKNTFEIVFKYKINLISKIKDKSDPKSVIAFTKKFNIYFKKIKIMNISQSLSSFNNLLLKKN